MEADYSSANKPFGAFSTMVAMSCTLVLYFSSIETELSENLLFPRYHAISFPAGYLDGSLHG